MGFQGLLVIILAFALAYFVYRSNRSFLWAGLAFLAGLLVIPLIMDQVRMLWAPQSSTPATTATALRSTSTSCNCN